jgi:agmatinase
MERDKAEKLISASENGLEPAGHNFGALPAELSSFETARVAVLPVPYDSTSSYGTGSRRGPAAIIEASRHMELYDNELDDLPARFGIHTVAELEPDARGPAEMAERIEHAVTRLIDAGKTVVSLGGDHSITYGIVKAFAAKHPRLSVLQLDAHADLRDEYQGTKYSHACTMRRVMEMVGRVSQVGTRSLSAGEASFIKSEGRRVHLASDWTGADAQVKEVLSELGTGPVYITCDLDVFDPAFLPATGTPEPGGLSWWHVLRLLRAIAGRRTIVGFDVVELIPMPGTVAPDFLAAKLAYKVIGLICSKGTDDSSRSGR